MALPRSASAMASRRSIKPPSSVRPGTSRAQSVVPTRSGALSPAESLSLAQSSNPVRKSPARSTGNKRKEREYENDGDGETNINVVVRCRGRSDREVRENSGVVVKTDGLRGKDVELSMGPSALSNKTYHFDKVFSPAADQSIIYDDVVAPILDEMLSGYNCTIFAYGQTGTGKTYTMSGDMSDTLGLVSDAAGVIPRVLSSLFRKLESDEGETSVKCSFIELYNEELRDLLSVDDGVKLKIYEEQKRGHTATLVQGMEEAFIRSAADGIKLLQNGSHKRQVAATKCNDLSSRSHTVFTVTAYVKRTTESGEDFVSAGKLNLVDLAGSENIQRSGAENKRAAEAGLINKSLLTLGRVINSLVERSSHIPYRESKLTRLLQDSLGGRTKTCIIATISPAKSNLEETISTLDYAFRAKNIRNKPQINQVISKKTMLREFTSEIEKLKSELIATRQRNGVYLATETYEGMLCESESLKILSDEQGQRIETMEISLRNKVQELFTLANDFMALKKDNEASRQTLDTTKSVLEQTEIVLDQTKKHLSDETILRHAHAATELALADINESLLSTIGKATSDVEGLHLKAHRRSELHKSNRAIWAQSQDHISDSAKSIELRLADFEAVQTNLLQSLSKRMEDFVKIEIEKLSTTQELLLSKANSFHDSKNLVIQQSVKGKDEMDTVLDEIKILREEVKRKVGEGLDGLAAGAGRISAGIINELGIFHTQLHTSYSSLGKDFRQVYDDVVQHVTLQQQETGALIATYEQMANSSHAQQGEIIHGLDEILQDERSEMALERQRMVSQITELINQTCAAQDYRLDQRVSKIKESVQSSRDTVNKIQVGFLKETADLRNRDERFMGAISQSRETLKMKMKEDWKAINDRSTGIQDTTRSVHKETIRIVDAQMISMSDQMHSLDDFVTRARQQNERHQQAHVETLKDLATNVEQSYDSIGSHCVVANDRVQSIGCDVAKQVAHVQAQLSSIEGSVKQPLREMGRQVASTALQEYVSSGTTPQKTIYEYPRHIPRTEAHEKILETAQPDLLPESPVSTIAKSDMLEVINSTSSIPQSLFSRSLGSLAGPVPKAIIYTDDPALSPLITASTAASTPTTTMALKTKQVNASLREINANSNTLAKPNAGTKTKYPPRHSMQVHANDKCDTGMNPPALKRLATMDATVGSRLPTVATVGLSAGQGGKAAGVGPTSKSGLVKLEGRENQSATRRRLRSSPVGST